MNQDELRARFALLHGAEAARRAEWLALRRLATAVHDRAIKRREAAEAVWLAALAEAGEMPPDWRANDPPDGPARPWPARWLPYVWTALAGFAEAAATEAEWSATVAHCFSVLGRLDATERPRRLVTHGWSEIPTVTWVYDAK